jgi:hypothetical protein
VTACAPSPPYSIGPHEDFARASDAHFSPTRRIVFPPRQGYYVAVTAIGYALATTAPQTPHTLRLWFGAIEGGIERRYVLANGTGFTFFSVFSDGERGLVVPQYLGAASRPFYLAIQTSGASGGSSRELRVSWRYVPQTSVVPDAVPDYGCR